MREQHVSHYILFTHMRDKVFGEGTTITTDEYPVLNKYRRNDHCFGNLLNSKQSSSKQILISDNKSGQKGF